MRRPFDILAVFLVVPLGLFARTALADCSMTEDYHLSADGGTVVICPKNFDGDGGEPRECPGGGALLRQETDGGGVVTVASYCSDAGCYIDECVKPGTYRYGYADPYECCSSCCGTAYFDSVTVGPTLGSCTPTLGDPGATDGGDVPWGVDGSVCGYAGEAGSDSDAAGPEVDEDSGVHTVPADASIRVPEAGSPDAGFMEKPGSGSSGCGCSIAGFAHSGAFAANLGALALGASILLRRRASLRRER